MKTYVKATCGVSVTALALGLASPACAQVTPADGATPPAQTAPATASDDGVQDIIVTANRRSESANLVGASITAVTGDTLTARGVTSAADLAKVVPGMVYTPTPYNTPVYTLRGVGYFDNSLAASPAVSVSVDEVPLAFPAMTQAAGLDIERVEVLKGPQGTLYGQNSTGGAINYIAAKPTSSFAAGSDISVARFGQVDASAFVSGPLSDTLRARIAVKTVQGGAWQKSVTRAGDTLGNSHQGMGRILLDWTPSSRLHVAVNLNGWHDGSDTLAGQVIAVTPTNPARVSPLLMVQTPLDAEHADWTPSNPVHANDTFYEGSVRADYEISDAVKLTSISAYQHFKQDKFSDLDGSAIRAGEFHQTGNIESFSQEVRLSGDTLAVRWIVGANYAHANVQDDLFDELTELSINQPLGPLVPPFNFSAAATHQTLNSYAGFGNVEVDVAPHVTLIGGLRYTQANRDFNGCTVIVDPNAATLVNTLQFLFKGSVIPVSVGQCGSLDANNNPGALVDSLREHNLSFRAAVNYKFDSGVLLYASVNRGYKSGGYPVLLTLSTDSFASIPQERIVAYETGFKLPLFEHHLQVNAAAFYYDYADKQLHGRTVDPYFGLIEKLVTVPKSRVAGAEISIDARPIPGLNISLAGSYVDTKVQKYTGFNAAGVMADYAGSAFPNTSKYQAAGDAQYSFPIASNVSAFLGGSFTYASTQSATFGSEPVFRIRPYTLVDLRAGIESKDGAWRASIWGRNITNVYYWNGVFQASDDVYRQPARPATYGVSLALRFH
ncbi:MAG: TonB-dependent receptor [Sphingomonas sp.]|jgi:outer membrane receptor protein involved in Fe transport|uniref:TonB-dependent receptor n=1 Tax=Sphingomonas sp. TaxID=28214 RepID=UPI0035671BFF